MIIYVEATKHEIANLQAEHPYVTIDEWFGNHSCNLNIPDDYIDSVGYYLDDHSIDWKMV